MSIASGSGLLLNPRSPAQTRALIAALKRRGDVSEATLDALLADVLVLEGQADPIPAVFDSTMVVGTPVRVLATGHADKAQADSVSNANVAGAVFQAANITDTGQYVPNGGRVSQADWTAVIGAAALTPGAVYYLSATAGLLTATAPTTAGQVVVKVGRALTEEIFVVEISVRVLL